MSEAERIRGSAKEWDRRKELKTITTTTKQPQDLEYSET